MVAFWGLEAYMERIQGVTDAVSGYANGKGDTTNYQLLHATDHAGNRESDLRSNKISLDRIVAILFPCYRSNQVLTSKAMIVVTVSHRHLLSK